MNGKRIAGILLGIFVGLMPAVNCIVAAIIAFKRKMKITGFSMIGVFIAFMIMGQLSSRDDIKVKKAGDTAAHTVATQLQAAGLDDTLITISQLDETVTTALKVAATKLISTDKEMARVFQTAADATYTDKEKKFVHDFALSLYDGYNRIKTSKAGKRMASFTFQDYTTMQENDIITYAKDFFNNYSIQEGTGTNGFLMFFIFIGYVFSIVICVKLFQNIFTQDKNNTGDPMNNYRPINQAPQQQPKRENSSVVYAPTTEQEVAEILENSITDNTSDNNNIVKINIASQEEISLLPGIGSVQALAIVNERQQNGPFAHISNFRQRTHLTDRVYMQLESRLDFSVPSNTGSGGKGRVIEF